MIAHLQQKEDGRYDVAMNAVALRRKKTILQFEAAAGSLVIQIDC